MPIPLSPISNDALEPLQRDLATACLVPKTAHASGMTIDVSALTAAEQALFDDGEILPTWADWWHKQAKRIEGMEGSALITLEPGPLGQQRVQAIEVEVLTSLFDTVPWTRCAGVVLAWGVPEDAMSRVQRGPIPCAGALTVVIDGCGALLVGDPEVVPNWRW